MFIIIFSSLQINAQKVCPASWNEWQWPTHSNWFVGYNNLVSFGAAGTSAPSAGQTAGPLVWDKRVYESSAAASDNSGNLVIMTNGVGLWDGAGNVIPVPGGKLLTGAENGTGFYGSAVQGVFIARHPLDFENYYIFTTDDVIDGENGNTNGFNCFIYNSVSNSVSGAIRLKDAAGNPYRSTEQIAATFHSNGIDVWVATHESTPAGTKKYFSYLITCDGLEEVPVESSTGFTVKAEGAGAAPGTNANERASLQFSWDGTRAGATHHNGNGTWDPAASLVLMRFDNLTGEFSDGNRKFLTTNGNDGAPYDCEFSPSGDRLYVTFQCWGVAKIGYLDVASEVFTSAIAVPGRECGALKVGGDGKMYVGSFKDCTTGWTTGIGVIDDPDGTPSYTSSALALPNDVGFGLGNMFIAPRDWLEIQDPGALTECDLPINLECLWECRRTDAENTLRYERAWSVKAGEGTTINDTTGIFDAPGPGTYEVYFEICDIKDTVIFTVSACGCDVKLDITDPICVGDTVSLNDLVIDNSGVGIWTVDSVPVTSGIDAFIDSSGVDTLFVASDINTKAGTYKLMFRVDNTCEDSLYIIVKPIPTVDIIEFGPLCDDSVITTMSAIPANGGDVTAGWAIDGIFNLTGVFNPTTEGIGWHEVIYGADSNGCTNSDTINVYVIERPDPVITEVGPYCANDLAVTLAVVPDSGVWSGPGVNALGVFTPSNVGSGDYRIINTITGVCGNADTIFIHVDSVRDASIGTSDKTMCKEDPAVVLIVAELGGTWFINDTTAGNELGGASFDPKDHAVGTYNLIYSIQDPCGDLDTVVMVINLEKDATILTPDSVICKDDPAVQLTVVEAGGTWFVNDTLVGSELGGTSFDPQNYVTGTYNLIYSIQDPCGDLDTIVIVVNPLKDATILTPDSVICKDDPAVQLTVVEAGGTWFVNDTLVGSELGGTSFNPQNYAAGTYDVIYLLRDPCGNLDTIVIVVNPEKNATILTTDSVICKDDPAVQLTVVETGGTWFVNDTLVGSELGGTSFDPQNYVTGTYDLIHVIGGQCGDIDTVEIIINPMRDATINTPNDTMAYCLLDPNPIFTVNESGGGTWDNAAAVQTGTNVEIDLATLGSVTNERFIYTIADPCGDADTIWITTTNKLDATITQVDPLCDSADSIKLNVVDAGGTFSGKGVNPITGSFDPKIAGVDTHSITYTIDGNCGDVHSIDIVVIRTPDPTITNTVFDFCEDHGDELLTVTEAGGTWRELNSANGGFTAGTSIFNTVNSEAGSFQIEYSFGGQCPAADTITLKVTALPVITFTPQDTLCVDATPVQINVTATPSTSGTWGGAVNATGIFDPTGKLGDNKIFYDALNGVCPASDTIMVYVLPRVDATIDPVPTQCVTSAPIKLVPTSGDSTGTWSSDGNGITNSIKGIFDPSAAGIGIHTITYNIGGKCGDTKTTTIEVVGAPDPTINIPDSVCPGSPAFPLTNEDVTNSGVWSGDVNTDGSFNPTVSGTFEAIYTLTALCPVADTIEFVVKIVPGTNFSVTPRTGCIPLTSEFSDISEEVPDQSIWDFGNSATSTDVISATNTYSTVGCYPVTLTNIYENGCTSDTTYPAAVCTYGIPESEFSWNPNPADVDNSIITFNNLSSIDAISYAWDFTDVILPSASSPTTTANPGESNDVNPTVDFTTSNGDRINVSLAVANQNGCVDTSYQVITIIDKFSVFVANAFTPNNDGINDTFFPKGRNLEFGSDYEFRVYDRWGSLIWMSTTPYEGWDGTVKELAPTSGDISQIDVYVWRLVVEDPFTGDKHELIGHVSLIR